MHTATPIQSARASVAPPAGLQASAMQVELLPFTIRCVSSEADLLKAVDIRHAAYARHVPEFAATLVRPEDCDYDGDSIVLLAESKLDGSALGSARIQTNRLQRLHLEESVELPLWLRSRQLAEVTRLGIGEGRIGRVVKLALIKACFAYCAQNGVEHAVVAGRAPLDRQYLQLLFSDVFPGQEMIALRHVGNLLHRVMSFDIASGQARWEAARHPLLDFFRNTEHPDIDVSNLDAARLWQGHRLAQLAA